MMGSALHAKAMTVVLNQRIQRPIKAFESTYDVITAPVPLADAHSVSHVLWAFEGPILVVEIWCVDQPVRESLEQGKRPSFIVVRDECVTNGF